MTYHKEEYILHNGQKIYAEYNKYNICQVSKECIEMLIDLYQQGRADAIDDFVHKVKEHHYLLSDVINSTDYGMFTVGIEQIAEELKEGVKQ